MTLLGEKLKAREARDKADTISKLERESREAGEKAMHDLTLVRQFFDRLRDEIIADISEDRPVRHTTLGKRGDGTEELANQILMTYNWYNNHGIAERYHKYFPVWEKFQQWAKSEGLEVRFVNAHDGVGIDSWYVLSVKAVA